METTSRISSKDIHHRGEYALQRTCLKAQEQREACAIALPKGFDVALVLDCETEFHNFSKIGFPILQEDEPSSIFHRYCLKNGIVGIIPHHRLLEFKRFQKQLCILYWKSGTLVRSNVSVDELHFQLQEMTYPPEFIREINETELKMNVGQLKADPIKLTALARK